MSAAVPAAADPVGPLAPTDHRSAPTEQVAAAVSVAASVRLGRCR